MNEQRRTSGARERAGSRWRLSVAIALVLMAVASWAPGLRADGYFEYQFSGGCLAYMYWENIFPNVFCDQCEAAYESCEAGCYQCVESGESMGELTPCLRMCLQARRACFGEPCII